jgi:hypothetical protein
MVVNGLKCQCQTLIAATKLKGQATDVLSAILIALEGADDATLIEYSKTLAQQYNDIASSGLESMVSNVEIAYMILSSVHRNPADIIRMVGEFRDAHGIETLIATLTEICNNSPDKATKQEAELIMELRRQLKAATKEYNIKVSTDARKMSEERKQARAMYEDAMKQQQTDVARRATESTVNKLIDAYVVARGITDIIINENINTGEFLKEAFESNSTPMSYNILYTQGFMVDADYKVTTTGRLFGKYVMAITNRAGRYTHPPINTVLEGTAIVFDKRPAYVRCACGEAAYSYDKDF